MQRWRTRCVRAHGTIRNPRTVWRMRIATVPGAMRCWRRQQRQQRIARGVWQAIGDDKRRAIGAVVAVAPPDADPLAACAPIVPLALAALHADDAALRTAGGAALTARLALVRSIREHLPPEMQHIPARRPSFADLMQTPMRSAIRRGLRR